MKSENTLLNNEYQVGYNETCDMGYSHEVDEKDLK